MARNDRPLIEAEVTLLSTEAGGRATPLVLSQGSYRPHLLVEDPTQPHAIGPKGEGTESYLGVQFRPIDRELSPGSSGKLWLELMYFPEVDYSNLKSGATFTIREGPKIVGFGRVLSRADAI
jgi:hypothetical protein